MSEQTELTAVEAGAAPVGVKS
ncbi:MAG: hypothetical protein QOD96_6909, partial [Pseudonocardiales bacterium]|nr:hypothetical protein [Pseudonocardiales bacterium]